MSEELSKGLKNFAKCIKEGWKLEGKKEVISEFVNDLEHIYKYFTKLTISNKIEKWEEKL